MPWTSDRRLYLTADDKVVEEGDTAAVSLLVGEGVEVDDETVKRYKLKSAAAPETKAVKSAPENKAVKAPAEDK